MPMLQLLHVLWRHVCIIHDMYTCGFMDLPTYTCVINECASRTFLSRDRKITANTIIILPNS